MVCKIATFAFLLAGSGCTAPPTAQTTPKVRPGLYDPVLTNLPRGSKLDRLYKTPIYLAEDGSFVEFVYPRTGRWRVEGDELIVRIRETLTIRYTMPEFELNTLRPKTLDEGTVYRIKSPTEFVAVLSGPAP